MSSEAEKDEENKDTANLALVLSSTYYEKRANITEYPIYCFTWLDFFIVAVSMGTFFADIVTDILVMLVYWKIDQESWAALTLTFLIFPAVVMQVFSSRWYMADGHAITISMVLIHFLMMGPVKRYVDVLRHGFQARKTKRIEDYQLVYSELSDVSMLRLFECFLESAPQLVLQLYIMIQVEEGDHILTGISACFSLLSLSWAIVAYTKALRTAVSKRNRVSWTGMSLQTIWRVGMVLGRITAIVLFATAYKGWTLLFLALHWLLMTVWVAAQDTDFCNTWWEERLFNAVVGVIYVFCFFNMKEGKSRWRAAFYYAVVIVENSVMIMLWWPHRTDGVWYNIPSLFAVWGGFLIGIASMISYYKYFHPASGTKCHCCLPWHKTCYLCRSVLCCLPSKLHDNTATSSTPYRKSRRNDFESTLSSDEELDHRDFTDLRCSYETPTTFLEDRVPRPPACNKHRINPHHRHLFETLPAPDPGCGVVVALVRSTSRKCAVQTFKPTKADHGRRSRALSNLRPRATSTPGDDLNAKPLQTSQRQIAVDSASNPSASGVDVDNPPSSVREEVARTPCEPYDVCADTPRTKLAKMCETPKTHKPGSPNTLVKNWVRANQEMYAQAAGCFSNSYREDPAQVLREPGTVLPSKQVNSDHCLDPDKRPARGRNTLRRLKSFSKRDRLKVLEGSPRNRRKSIRDSFREAFGFQVIDLDQVTDRHRCANSLHVEAASGKVDKSGDLSRQWYDLEEAAAKRKKHTKKSKNINTVKCRVDEPPNLSAITSLQTNLKKEKHTQGKSLGETEARVVSLGINACSGSSKHIAESSKGATKTEMLTSGGVDLQKPSAAFKERSRYDNVSSDDRSSKVSAKCKNDGILKTRVSTNARSSDKRPLDRVEILKKHGKSALSDLAKDSLARKQLRFKQVVGVPCRSVVLHDNSSNEGALNVSVKALGNSMEGLAEAENYRLHLRRNSGPDGSEAKRSSHTQRRTLGSIENKPALI